MSRQEVETEVVCNPQRGGDNLLPVNVPADLHAVHGKIEAPATQKICSDHVPKVSPNTALRVSLHSTEALDSRITASFGSYLKHIRGFPEQKFETTDKLWAFPMDPCGKESVSGGYQSLMLGAIISERELEATEGNERILKAPRVA